MIVALQTLIFFRESLLSALDRLLRPYYKRFSLVFSKSTIVSDDDESDEQVFSVYDDERGVVFYPPVYTQRYAAVSDCLMDERWCGKLEKVVDLGYHDISFIKYLKEVPGVRCILGVDIESIPLRCSSDLFGCEDYVPKSENPLQVTLFQGNAADPDYRLIGCDAVIAIEMIEHMLPHDLDRLIHTVFGFIKPWIVIFTTPNGDFNVLFKSLETNGLRRLDHFFEWTQEQFHDWCSNIVLRYPQYSVTCRGIGPGPPDTRHLGCCSQMALFVSKDYHKQQDLNLNSLSLVTNAPNPNNLSIMTSNSDIVDSYIENSMLPNIIQSYTELFFSEKHSALAVVIASPSFSFHSLEYRDKTSQCNLDSEVGKNFLMFDDEQMCFDIVMPRRKMYNKVYEIEDVNSRLNCTTLQVNTFSKTTQNLMAKNKIDSLVHTREVVDEIRHLTNMLNFNKECLNQDVQPYLWANINWGDNAPYWNQYYKIVREYNHPYETKSEECRILDLISDEINKLIDMQFDEDFCVNDNKLEIPLQHLMGVVQHITEDVDRVRDLLEWNGYEIVDDIVIHSRLIVDKASVVGHEEDWQDNDTLSDWDITDLHDMTTSLSDGSAIAHDYYGRCLRRALDNKLRKLRSMLTADEEITTELDRVVCRLMKLALRNSKGQQNPPPTRWLQCKLLDLLSLTEKTIEKRRRHFIETYSPKAINYVVEDNYEKNIALEEIEGDDIVDKIVDKYRYLIEPTVINKNLEDYPSSKNIYPDVEPKDDWSFTRSELLKEFEYVDRQSPGIIDPELILDENTYESDLIDHEEINFDRVRNWVEEDNIEVVPYPNHNLIFDNSSGDTDHSSGFVARIKRTKTYDRFKSISTYDVNNLSFDNTHKTKVIDHKRNVKNGKINSKKMISKKVKIIKQVKRIKSNCSNILKNNKNVDRKFKRLKWGHTTSSKPIPKSLIELCHPELSVDKCYDTVKTPVLVGSYQTNENNNEENTVSATEESYLIAIVMEDMEESIALRRGIATNTDSEPLECETVIQCINHESSHKFYEEHVPCTENVESQTIFLNDINEPSTSKGIRHISMDVQCGSDNIAQSYSMLSATTSYTKMHKLTDIGNLYNNLNGKNIELGTSTDDPYVHNIVSPNTKSIGIRIRDSDQTLLESGIIMQEVKDTANMSLVIQSLTSNETKLLKAVSSNLKIEDSGSDFSASVGSLLKNSLQCVDVEGPYKIKTSLSLNREVPLSNKLSSTKYVKPILCCGGVHIHSYKDNTVSEDVVYQGEWQKYRPSSFRKRSFNAVILNRVNQKRQDLIKNKQIMTAHNKEIDCEIQKHIPLRNSLLRKPKHISKTLKNETVTYINKTTRHATIINIKKIASNHAIGALKSKSNYKSKKPVVLSSINPEKETNIHQRLLLENYIPKYLRKRDKILSTSVTKNLNENLNVVETKRKVIKTKMSIDVPISLKYQTKKLKSDLLKFHSIANERMNFLVYRNELDGKKNPLNGESANPEQKLTNKNNVNNKPHSPQSQNSSSCSSPNSIATIRFVSQKPKSVAARRNTTPWNDYINDSGSETPSPTRLKKFTKRLNSCKITKNKICQDFDNKENLSEKINLNSKRDNKIDKTMFKGSQKNVFMAQLNTNNKSLQSTLPSVSKYKPQYSNPKFPSENNVNVKCTSGRPSGSKTIFLKTDDTLVFDDNINKISENSSTKIKADLLIEPRQQIPNQGLMVTNNTIESNSAIWTESDETDSNLINIGTAMRQFLEETLNLFVIPCKDEINADFATVSSHEGINTEHQNATQISSKNIHTSNSKLNSTLDIVAENDLNDSFNMTLGDVSLLSFTDTNIDMTDLDLLSFKSIMSETKLSESYFDGCDFNTLTPKSNSVREIFEKKDDPLSQIPGGTLAMQAFSGFSINGELFVGDQPDHINFVDSETGSLAFEIARQATSEEIFVSSRSSDSYESCVVDEDTIVPNWLFRILSQQQSVTEEESDSLNQVVPMPVEGPIPLAEPVHDINGNTGDPGVGSGAGDGRGIHSDYSQDSSGRGTSLSSSETSSGQQSEAIIIDPSAFLEQSEPISERSTLAVPLFGNDATQLPGSIMRAVEEQVVTSTLSSRDNPRLGLAMAGSDLDADISSLNTDATDSSDC